MKRNLVTAFKALIAPIIMLCLPACATKSLVQRSSNSTLVLTKDGIIEKNIQPSKSLNLRYLDTQSPVTETSTQKPTEENQGIENKKDSSPTLKTTKLKAPLGQNRRLIELGTQPIRGYSKLEVYTEIPVPVQYSPARVITSNGQATLIPATPTQIQRVRVGPTSQISGFIDYGPTINVPVRTRDGVRYIPQKSPMPMPIIDRISVTYEE